MTDTQKVETVLTILDDGGALPSEEKVETYLALAKAEILAWMYPSGIPDDVTDIPTRYENVQIFAVVAGYTHAGAEGEKVHNENGVSHTFIYADMLDYIHGNVSCGIKVG